MSTLYLDHNIYMYEAITEAQKAASIGEVPIGAVVVDKDGTVIGRGYNNMEHTKCQTGHAEVMAITQACKTINDWRLIDCTLYVTLEPCMMCFGLIQLSRIKRVVFGAKSPKTHHIPDTDLVVIEGIKEVECVRMLQDFFQSARKRRKENEAKEGFL